MIQSDDQLKRDQLHDLLIELAQSQDFLSPKTDHTCYFKRLEKIYYNCNDDNFRHYYSDIFSTLSLIDGDSSLGSLDILAQNIQAIKDEYEIINKDTNGQTINISKQIRKLYDHTNLDIARINYANAVANDTKSELAKTKALIDQLEKHITNAEVRLNDISQKNLENVQKLSTEVKNSQNDMQKDYISILGIFASIVLAFTGGLAFSSSVLQNIGNASAYRIILISLIIAFVLFNIIWLMIDFIREICNKDISQMKCGRKWIWLVTVNTIIVLSFIFTCWAYKYDWFARDIDSDENTTPSTYQTEETIPTITESMATAVTMQPTN